MLRARAIHPLISTLIAGLFAICAPTAARAEAHDWLALYPDCGFGAEARALGRMSILYPRPGLPAVVVAGDTVVTRVRVPSGLTPPPGIQKDRALRGWSAELVGQSFALSAPGDGAGDGAGDDDGDDDGGGEGVHAYRPRVRDVRPDGQSTLVYRASITVPTWVAPGTYGLRLSAPGGRDAIAASIVVLARSAEEAVDSQRANTTPAPRLVRATPPATGDRDAVRAFLESLAFRGDDVVVGPAHAEVLEILGAAPPTARLPAYLAIGAGHDTPAVLRVGDRAVVLGRCDDRYAPFDVQLDALTAREGLSAVSVSDAVSALPMVEGSSAPVVVDREGDTLTIVVPDSRGADLSVRYVDDGRGVRIEGADSFAFYPAVSVPMTGAVRTIAARLVASPGAVLRVARGPASAASADSPDLAALVVGVEPAEAVTGQTVRFSISEPGLARIAWRIEEDITATTPTVEHAFLPVGDLRVDAFVISTEGVGQPLRGTVTIKTREVRGCNCAIPGQRGLLGADLWLVVPFLLRMVVRRRRE